MDGCLQIWVMTRWCVCGKFMLTNKIWTKLFLKPILFYRFFFFLHILKKYIYTYCCILPVSYPTFMICYFGISISCCIHFPYPCSCFLGSWYAYFVIWYQALRVAGLFQRDLWGKVIEKGFKCWFISASVPYQ